MDTRMNRRTFLQTTGGAGLVVLTHAASSRTYGANEKLGIAQVGVGGRGWELLRGFSRGGRTVALCDVNEQKATVAYKRFPKLPRFKDFRVMLDKMGKAIDAVVVATPDHTHAVASAAAIRAGKPVYVEKPVSRLVEESRLLRKLAAEHKVATSMGNQGTASSQFRRAIELIRGGTLGEIKAVHAWNDQGGRDWTDAPKGPEKIPFYLDWDLWLGPTRERPFHPKWMAWHGWRDFGTCNLGNWASHTLNLAVMALKVDSLWHAEPATKPRIRVEAKVNHINRLSFPRWELVRWHIPARGKLPPITFHWHNGGRRPGIRDELAAILGRPLHWGQDGKWDDWARLLIVGAEGKILCTAHNATFDLLPKDKFKQVKKDAPETLDRSRGHSQDWLLACRGGKPAWANFDYAGPLTELNMLGNVATQFEGVLEFDPLACKILNNPEADRALHLDYRKGWAL